ncbi:MAG: hypothetical protein KC620_24905, partial [Myxococcales bacterium]|nr:hypothetical protein [Myxococcales bacterium]
RVGVDRTVHFAADDPDALDRTSVWLDGRQERGQADRFGLGAELRGTLAGRVGDPHHLGAGLSAWWRRPTGAPTPFVRLRGYGFLYGDAAARPPDERFEVWTELAAGLSGPLGPLHWDARLNGQWVGPGALGFTGGGADLQLALPLGRFTLSALAGAAARFGDSTDVALPRAGAGLGLTLGGGLSAQIDGLWQRAIPFETGATVDRWLGGLSLACTW